MKAFGEYITIAPIITEMKTASGLMLDKKLVRFREGEVVLSSIKGIDKGVRVIYDSSNTHKSSLGENYLITKARDIAIIL